MNVQQLAICLGWGALLIVLGLVPGLFQRLVNGVQNSIKLFSEQLGWARPIGRVEARRQPTWLAGFGAAMLLIGVLGYFLPG